MFFRLYRCTLRRLTYFVCRVLYARVVGATSSEDFLAIIVLSGRWPLRTLDIEFGY